MSMNKVRQLRGVHWGAECNMGLEKSIKGVQKVEGKDRE